MSGSQNTKTEKDAKERQENRLSKRHSKGEQKRGGWGGTPFPDSGTLGPPLAKPPGADALILPFSSTTFLIRFANAHSSEKTNLFVKKMN